MEKDRLFNKPYTLEESEKKWGDLDKRALIEAGKVDDGLTLAICRDKTVFTCHHLLLLREDGSIYTSSFGNIEQIILRAEKILRRYRDLAPNEYSPFDEPGPRPPALLVNYTQLTQDPYVHGEVSGADYYFMAKVFDGPDPQGINCGRVCLLEVTQRGEHVIRYDKRWVISPGSAQLKLLTWQLVNELEKLPLMEQRNG